MKKIFFYVLSAILALGLMQTEVSPAQSSDAFLYLQPQHKAILQQWLQRHPRLRLAAESDCKNRQGLRAMRQEYGRAYQPYYAVGDFNSDGREDFAVALINRQRRVRSFAVAIFNGPLSSGPAFYTEGADLSAGGLIWRADNRLLAGVFQTDDCAVLRPRGRGYVMQPCG